SKASASRARSPRMIPRPAARRIAASSSSRRRRSRRSERRRLNNSAVEGSESYRGFEGGTVRRRAESAAAMEAFMMVRWIRGSLIAAVAVASLAMAGAAGAQPAPGTVINKANADTVKDFVSPGVLWCVQHGMAMKIIPYKKIEWNPAFKEATEKY